MTYRDYVRDHFPSCISDKAEGGVHMCPCAYGFKDSSCSAVDWSCDDCWGRKISDEDQQRIEYGEIHGPTAKVSGEA